MSRNLLFQENAVRQLVKAARLRAALREAQYQLEKSAATYALLKAAQEQLDTAAPTNEEEAGLGAFILRALSEAPSKAWKAVTQAHQWYKGQPDRLSILSGLLYGGGAGAVAGLGAYTLSRKERKNLIKNLIIGSLLGGTIGGGVGALI